MRSLGLVTDLLALEGLAEVERHPTHVVVRTPAEPDYWSGNGVILLSDPGDPGAEAALFRRHFPEASHVNLAWDRPGLDPAVLRPLWEPRGFEVELSDVLARRGPPPEAPTPPGYALRELATDGDWTQAHALGMELGAEDGHDPDRHGPFLRRRLDGRRAQVAAGIARWWGAFAGAELAAMMGMVQGPGLARYQAVHTGQAHRRRGLCAALLRRAAEEALARDPGATLVIVADTDGAPGRLYRRAGFDLAERNATVMKRGY